MDCLEYRDGAFSPCKRDLAGEAPLRIVVDGKPVATLMRTPGDEQELALGFLLTEGIARSPDEIGALSFCAEGQIGNRNEVRVTLASAEARSQPLPQHRRVFSSCGICGTEAIEDVANGIVPFDGAKGRLSVDDVFNTGEAMRVAQERYRRTGATHAAALALPPVRRDSDVITREDIGRHNALDKVVGVACRQGIPFGRGLLFLSGRTSFEMVTKAARAGIGDLASVGAPTALAVALAERLGMFLACFVRGRAMTMYSGHSALQEQPG